MEAIEDKPDVRVVGAAHDLPGIAVIVDMPAPGKRLLADLQPAFLGTLAQFAEVGGRPVDPAKRVRRDVGADEDEVRPPVPA